MSTHRSTIFCVTVIAGVLFFCVLPASLFAQQNFMINITDPARDGVEVGKGMTVRGIAVAPGGYHLWVFARRIDFEGVWWPQGEGRIDPQNRQWKVSVILGGEQDIGWEFDIAAMIFSEDGNILLQNYRREAMKTGSWKPIEVPPSACPPQIRKVKKVSDN